MTPIKIGEKVVEWTWTLGHCAQVLVTRGSVHPYNWSADIQSNGSLHVSCQLGDFYIGEITKQAEGPIPDGGIVTGYPMRFYLSFQLLGTGTEIVYKLPLGTNVRAICGTLTVTAVCDVMFQQVDEGEHGWPLDGEPVPSVTGPLYDTPNNTRSKVYLQLTENANWEMVTNYGTYTGVMALTDGTILDNRLESLALVDCKSSTVEASGIITATNSLGSYLSDYSSHSWTDGSASCSGAQATGAVEAVAHGVDGFETHSRMGCTWSMERVADLEAYVCDQAGTGIDADLFISRHADDTLPTKVSCSNGGYSEAISQSGFVWTWEATHRGNWAPGPNTGGSYNWGDLNLALDIDFNNTEQQALPAGWAAVNSGYLTHKDGTMPIHLFNYDGVVDIVQAAAYTPKIGYSGGNYSLTLNTLTASGGAANGAQVGTWRVSSGASLELDATNERILVKPAAEDCLATRTLLLDAGQCIGAGTKPPRDAWTGYRWLSIVLEPANSSDGTELDTVGQTIIIEVDQDDMAGLFAEPDVQTWTSAANKTKRYTAVTQRQGNTTFVDIDLARPMSPTSTVDGENPPVTGNHGAEDARPNVLSHWPKPTQDAAHGAVTNACEVRLTLPTGSWWRIGEFQLHHKAGAQPAISLMPGYNQWIRMERRDKIDDDDFEEAKLWARRLFYSTNEGMLGAEAFDIERSTSYDTETGVHTFGYAPFDVATMLAGLTKVEQLKHFPTAVNAGAIRLHPGWDYTVTLPAAGIDHNLIDHLMLVACNLGGRGITWAPGKRICWSNLSLSDYGGAIVLQGITNSLDWFGGCGDVFKVEDGDMTGALQVRAGTVLRGAVDGGVATGRTYNLFEHTRPGNVPSTIASAVPPDEFGHLRINGGLPKLDHEVIPTSSASKATFDGAHTIAWTLPTDTVIEAPSWWEQRGCYRCLMMSTGGINHPRFRASDGAPLCQKVGVGRSNEGRCVFCPHGL